MKADKEIGINKNASPKAKALDRKLDAKHNVKEGSKADLKLDRKINKADKAGKLKNIQSY